MKAHQRRQQILEQAKIIFAHNGYRGTNIAMICQAAGIGRGTLYQYFGNKNSVFEATIDLLIEQIETMLESSAATVKNLAEYRDMVTEKVEQILGLLQRDRDFALVAFNVSHEFPELKRRIDATIIAIIKAKIDVGRRMGLLRDDIDLDLVAINFYGGLEKVVQGFLSNPAGERQRHSVADIARQIIALVFSGILATSRK